MASTNPVYNNKLLSSLPVRERRQVVEKCSVVDLACGDVLHHPGERVRYVYFPLGSVISIHVTVEDNSGLEVGMVGSEGFWGASPTLGVPHSHLCATVHCAGPSFRVRTTELLELLDDCPGLRQQLHRFVHVIVSQLAQTAYCTSYHRLEARVARWLLMTHDRISEKQFKLTHELLAEMLGVRRSGVSIAAASLQAQQLISYNRGTIRVINRKGLEAAACECYSCSKKIYDGAFA